MTSNIFLKTSLNRHSQKKNWFQHTKNSMLFSWDLQKSTAGKKTQTVPPARLLIYVRSSSNLPRNTSAGISGSEMS